MKYIVIKKTEFRECIADFCSERSAVAFVEEEKVRQIKKGNDKVSFEIVSELGGQDID